MQAACVPASLPEEENIQEESRSRSSGSAQCPSSSLSATELTDLNTKAQSGFQTILTTMRQAKTAIHMRLNMSDSLPVSIIIAISNSCVSTVNWNDKQLYNDNCC